MSNAANLLLIGDCWRCGHDDQYLYIDPLMTDTYKINNDMDLIRVCGECAAERYVIYCERKENSNAEDR